MSNFYLASCLLAEKKRETERKKKEWKDRERERIEKERVRNGLSLRKKGRKMKVRKNTSLTSFSPVYIHPGMNTCFSMYKRKGDLPFM